MSTTKNLLVELFVEELPPKALKKLGEAFAQTIATHLKQRGLADDHSATTSYATPRRLAVHLSHVRAEGQPQPVSVKLVPVDIAYDANGAATQQLVSACVKKAGFPSFQAASEVGAFVVREESGKRYVFHETLAAGKPLSQALQSALDEALVKLPIPKVMQYQLEDGWTSVNFVRPAHGLVALHGADVVPLRALGLSSGRETQGHRFEASMSPVVLQDADHYAHQLDSQGAVIASFASRHGEIVRQLNAAAAREGLTPIDDAALLDEVTALVERPNVLLCQFEEEFLAVPQECLILTMKANQKYFPLLDVSSEAVGADGRGKLTNKFLVVSNIRPADASRVIEGNERVVRPRLADAKFFFDQDRKKTLESRVPGLDKVVYHGKLGTQGARVTRVRQIAGVIAALLPHGGLAKTADRAALLAKADLVTDMVGEFPELQGTMGGYYARHDGEGDEVAAAIEDHYKPRFAGDELPRNKTGVVVALADKLETLVGLFGIGQLPTGDKDPFALRRHALGVIRLLIERALPVDLNAVIDAAVPAFGALIQDPRAALQDFIFDRLAGSLREQGYTAHEVDAVLSQRPQRLADIAARLVAVRAFSALPEAASLAAANKRVGNILKKVEGARPVDFKRGDADLPEAAERQLARVLADVGPQAEVQFNSGDYRASLLLLAALKAPVDAFFDTVMVNADDPALRANRLGLLAQLHAAMNRVADLSKLAA